MSQISSDMVFIIRYTYVKLEDTFLFYVGSCEMRDVHMENYQTWFF